MIERRNYLKRLFFGGLLVGLLATAFLALVEVVFLAAWANGARTAGMPSGLLGWSALAGFLVGPLLGGLLGLVMAGVHTAAEPLAAQRRYEPMWKARLWVLLALPAIAWLVTRASAGDWISRQPGVRVLAALVGVILLGTVYAWARVLGHVGERLTVGHAGLLARVLSGPALLALAAGLYLADQLVLARLYTWLHWTLAFLAFLTAWQGVGALHLALGRDLRRRIGGLARPLGAAVIAVGAMAAGLAAHQHLGRSNQLRAMVFERTALASKVLRISGGLGLLPRAALPPAVEVAAPRPAGRPFRPVGRGADVVLVTIDALRVDRLGLLRSDRAGGPSLTPNLDRIFGKGARFSRAYCPTPRTSYSLVSLLTGQPLYRLLRAGATRKFPTLAELLTEPPRYRTAAFYPLAIFTIDPARFESYRTGHLGFEHFVYEDEDLKARRRTDQVLGFVSRHQQDRSREPLFLWAHYFDPHEPYQAEDQPHRFGTSASARYDAEVAYTDREVGRLLDGIRKLRPQAIFVLTADHAEAFGEHGATNHGTSVFDEQVRVPILLVGPGIPDVAVSAPVSTLALPAAILRLLQRPVPDELETHGDLTAHLGDPGYLGVGAVSEVASLRSFAFGQWKLIQDLDLGYTTLYDLAADPGELRPLNIDGDDAARRRASLLLGHLGRWTRQVDRLLRRNLGRPAATAHLALAAPDVEQRRAAATALLREAAQPGLSREAAHALQRALGDVDPEVRHRALVALAADAARAGRPVDASTLLPILGRPDLPAEIRLPAALALAAGEHPAAGPPLAALLPRTREVDTRIQIVKALGTLQAAGPEVLAALTEALADHETVEPVLTALSRLARRPLVLPGLGDAAAAVGRLLPRRREHQGQRDQAMATLACLRTPNAVALLAGWLQEEPDPALRARGLALLTGLVVDAAGPGTAGLSVPLAAAGPRTFTATLPGAASPRTLWLVVEGNATVAPRPSRGAEAWAPRAAGPERLPERTADAGCLPPAPAAVAWAYPVPPPAAAAPGAVTIVLGEGQTLRAALLLPDDRGPATRAPAPSAPAPTRGTPPGPAPPGAR
jgi:arylsulfatase A-like enzyme